MKFRVRIPRLLDTSLHSDKDERRIIKSALGGKPELLLERQRRERGVGAHGLEVWRKPENTLRLPAIRTVRRLPGVGRHWRRSGRLRMELRAGP